MQHTMGSSFSRLLRETSYAIAWADNDLKMNIIHLSFARIVHHVKKPHA